MSSNKFKSFAKGLAVGYYLLEYNGLSQSLKTFPLFDKRNNADLEYMFAKFNNIITTDDRLCQHNARLFGYLEIRYSFLYSALESDPNPEVDYVDKWLKLAENYKIPPLRFLQYVFNHVAFLIGDINMSMQIQSPNVIKSKKTMHNTCNWLFDKHWTDPHHTTTNPLYFQIKQSQIENSYTFKIPIQYPDLLISIMELDAISTRIDHIYFKKPTTDISVSYQVIHRDTGAPLAIDYEGADAYYIACRSINS